MNSTCFCPCGPIHSKISRLKTQVSIYMFWNLRYFTNFYQILHNYRSIELYIFCITLIYRAIKKSLCTWWLKYRKLQVMFKLSPPPQTFIDTSNCLHEDRVQCSTVLIPIAFCDGHLQIINCVRTVIVRCTQTFWSPCTSWLLYIFSILKLLKRLKSCWLVLICLDIQLLGAFWVTETILKPTGVSYVTFGDCRNLIIGVRFK